jgi:hypothetical protein
MSQTLIHDDRWIYATLWRLASPGRSAEPIPQIAPEVLHRMLAIARLQGVLGLVLERVGVLEVRYPKVWDNARRAWNGQVVQSMRVRRHAQKVLFDLAAVGIPAVSIKGIDFADHLYEQPRLRPTLDVDVLVARERWQDAAIFLEATGHSEKNPQPPIFLPSGVLSERTWVYKSTLAMEVDLHWSLVHFPFFRRQCSVGYWELDRQWPEDLAAPAPLTAASRLLIAVVHAVYHHQFERLLELVDIVQAARKINTLVDLQQTRALVERTGAGLAVDLALQVTARYLEDPSMDALRQRLFALPNERTYGPVPEAIFEHVRSNLCSITSHFNAPGRKAIREWLLAQPARPEPGREFRMK